MKSLIQYKFEEYSLDISNAEYKYILYNRNETTKPDGDILYEGLGNSYVELPIELNIETSTSQKNYAVSRLDVLRALDRNIGNFSIFNKLNEYTRDFFKYYHDKKNKNLKSIARKTDIASDDLILHQNKGFILNLNKDYEEHFKNACINTLTFNNEEFLSVSDNVLGNNTLGLEWFERNPNFTLGMTPLQEVVSYDDVSLNNDVPVCVGFLVEKYSNNKLLKKSFFLSDELRNSREIKQIKKTIKDSNVKYGKEYKYVVYPVFLATFPKENDYHIVQDVLICDTPYIVDINCIETNPPEVPNKVLFHYTRKTEKLTIEWSRPYNIENDIKGYYIFKRYSLEEPFMIAGVIDFTDPENIFNPSQTNIDIDVIKSKNHLLSFEDKNYNPNKITIYSVCSFDAHGNFSNYSEQLVLLYDYTRKKLLVDLISLSGAPLHLPNIHIPRNVKYFGYQESIEDVVPILKDKKKITLYCTPDFITIKDVDETSTTLLKENYILNIFKLENQKSFTDTISVRNFENINNN